jgi:hypothetical protein
VRRLKLNDKDHLCMVIDIAIGLVTHSHSVLVGVDICIFPCLDLCPIIL